MKTHAAAGADAGAARLYLAVQPFVRRRITFWGSTSFELADHRCYRIANPAEMS